MRSAFSGRAAFQSTLPARGATGNAFRVFRQGGISIHAPRTGSDRSPSGQLTAQLNISIHAPRTGSDERPTR